MAKGIKYIGLSVGLLLTIFSFLYYGRNQVLYNALLVLGLLLSTVFLALLVFGKGTAKQKITVVAFVCLAASLQKISEPFLIDESFRIFTREHQSGLAIINNILKDYRGSFVLGDSIRSAIHSFPAELHEKISVEKNKVGASYIEHNDKGIYYQLFGFLDVRIGIIYWTGVYPPGDNYRILREGWVR